MNRKARALYLSHGGGPMPLLGEPNHQALVDTMREISASLPRPDAIVVISAHWEGSEVLVQSNPAPSMYYDYYNFPPVSYTFEYNAPGAPALAEELVELIRAGGLDAAQDLARGFDHGLFVPLMLLYPAADIPCLQVSLHQSLDAELHIRLGEALAPLRDRNILLVGSGFSFHNMRVLRSKPAPQHYSDNEQFATWVAQTCTDEGLTEAARRKALKNWASAPGARFSHPREEHLLPLQVCYGFAGAPAEAVETFSMNGWKAVHLRW